MIIFILPYNVSITFFQVAHDEKSSLAKLSLSMMAQLVVTIRIYRAFPIVTNVCYVIRYIRTYQKSNEFEDLGNENNSDMASKMDTYLSLPRIGECLSISRIIS